MPEKSSKKTLGDFGEDTACRYLERRGWRVVQRNFRCRLGEIDIIAENGTYLAFCEVKLRKNAAHGQAREFVTPAKQRKVILAAEFWLEAHPTRLQPRFDVIEIYAPQGTETVYLKIDHIEDAYQL